MEISQKIGNEPLELDIYDFKDGGGVVMTMFNIGEFVQSLAQISKVQGCISRSIWTWLDDKFEEDNICMSIG